jgi:hypothetical protein
MQTKATIFLLLIFGAILYAGISRSTGIVGRTQKNGEGCTCHSPQKDLAVNVQVTGPDTLIKGQTGEYQITLSGGPAVKGGFNVASFLGSLNIVDASAQLMAGELTHTSPKTFSSGSASWSFTLTAANQVYTDTIYSAANSVNGDGTNSALDRWNFGSKFIVNVVDEPSSVDDDNTLANNFKLAQNYPNPFNPSTMISYSIPQSSFVTLKVYDIIGNEVATLVNETKSAGKYDVRFDASNLSNGVYLYSIKTDNFTSTKKMILMK